MDLYIVMSMFRVIVLQSAKLLVNQLLKKSHQKKMMILMNDWRFRIKYRNCSNVYVILYYVT